MKNAMIVFRKEFYRVISDKRLLVMSVLFPGIMIFGMYSLMGNVMKSENADVQMHEMVIYHENTPTIILDELAEIQVFSDKNEDGTIDSTEFDYVPLDLHLASELTQVEIEEKILAGEIDMLIKFPADFEAQLDTYEDTVPLTPNIEIVYNPGENYSNQTYYNVSQILDSYSEFIIYGRFGGGITPFNAMPTYIVNEDKAAGQAFAMLLPMLIIMFLFSGAMNIGPDSIAGEKERGTIATLLVTPVKRFEIAIGKVLSLSVISLMSATSSFVGIIFGLKNMMGGAGEGELNANIYGMNDYLMIIAVLFASVLVIVGIIAVVSTYARTIKEAGMLILPFYFLSIIVGISSMFSGEAASNTILYLIPIYNSVNMLISILTFEVVPVQFILMVTSSVVYVSILIFVMNKLFQSEKVMFSK